VTGEHAPAVDVFDGVRVVELAQFGFVPAAGALLADRVMTSRSSKRPASSPDPAKGRQQ
jgi:hypothetical protein